MSQSPPLLLFDGDCGFCTTCATWMRRHIRRLDTTIPYQQAELDEFGLTAAQCEESLKWVGADGTVFSAELAVAHVLIDAGKGWALIGRTILLPGIRQLCGAGYRSIARNRYRLPGGTPACASDQHRTTDR